MVVFWACYARTGGTILNQCLGCLPKTLILSSIHKELNEPEKNLKAQAKWHGMQLSSENFDDQVCEVIETNKDKVVIIRDFSLWPTFETLHMLKARGYQPKTFASIRNPYDIIHSLHKYLGGIPSELSKELRAYAETVKDWQKIRFEQFTESPESALKDLCKTLDIQYSGEWRNYKQYTKVKGEVDLSFVSRGRLLDSIQPLPKETDIAQEVLDNPNLRVVSQLWNYS